MYKCGTWHEWFVRAMGSLDLGEGSKGCSQLPSRTQVLTVYSLGSNQEIETTW